MILFDSNVLVAALIVQHPHHEASTVAMLDADPVTTLLAAHSLAEAYSVLTRRNLPFQLDGIQAWVQLQRFADHFPVVTLSAIQTLDAVRRFSAMGTGPRLYDYLIGVTGQTYGADTIVTWNTRDFAGLFPALRIVTPDELAAELAAEPPRR